MIIVSSTEKLSVILVVTHADTIGTLTGWLAYFDLIITQRWFQTKGTYTKGHKLRRSQSTGQFAIELLLSLKQNQDFSSSFFSVSYNYVQDSWIKTIKI